MKKLFASILCFVYATASSGTTINFHYCMGKFIGWNIAVPAPATCNNCGMHTEQKKGCCNDKHATLLVKKDQLAATSAIVSDNRFVYIQSHYSTLVSNISVFNTDILQSIHGPPLVNQVSTIVLNCNFRI